VAEKKIFILQIYKTTMENILDENKHHDDTSTDKNDECLKKRHRVYGECPTCNRYNTNYSWCQSCDPKLLTEGWTSGNETLDELIKSTQLKATRYDNDYYLQWIPYNDLTNIEKIGEGGFATISKATWLNGYKDINYDNKERISKDMPVALKKLHNSQNISDEFLNEVNYFIIIVFKFFPLLVMKFYFIFYT